MLKNTIIICALVAASAFAGDYCADFVVVNIATNDTALHFTQKGLGKGEITNGDCHYETDWFGSGVQWRCENMYLVKDGQSLYIPKRNGEFSQKQFTFACESIW